jgi:hypothetical protein
MANPKLVTRDVLALSVCIYRHKGFVGVGAYPLDPEVKFTNKDFISATTNPSPDHASIGLKTDFKITDADYEKADAIIKYYRRLSFNIIGDNISDYFKKIFDITQKDTVTRNDFGVIASIPSCYERELIDKEIKNTIKNTEQGYIGEPGQTVYLNIEYIKTRFVPKLNCFSHDAVTEDNYLVSFLNKIELAEPRKKQRIRAKVKQHSSNFFTKTAETQLNYVKVIETFEDLNVQTVASN